uniref:Uncharacterized protein n=1 Tax=viral metagenome TaxID=1070528 RepID=A0A6M3LWH4_9ZZZZ
MTARAIVNGTIREFLDEDGGSWNESGALGARARDSVTGFDGVITAIQFEYGGSTTIRITAEALLDGKINEAWFDESRCVPCASA